jgi:TonB-linked SusC/RagA family outer membrane protein
VSNQSSFSFLFFAGALLGASGTIAESQNRQVASSHVAMARSPAFFVATEAGIRPLEVTKNPVLRSRIAVDFDGVPVRDALAEIEKRSGMTLMYLDSVIPAPGVVHLRAEGITVAAALLDVLDGTDVDVVFTTSGAAALVRRKPPPPAGIVMGTISDARGPIAFASVVVEGTGHGATATAVGTYRLVDVPAGTHTITARRIGYLPGRRAVTVGDDATVTVDFTLEVAPTGLEAVVVTGTPGGTQRRAVGNVVASVNAREVLEASPVTNVQAIMTGQTPGVSIASGRGEIGSAGTIRIRGASTLGLSSDPLVYIDGVRMNSNFGGPNGDGGPTMSRINDINPQDIESIEIIKGPAAATLYGTEASSGVIQIITKRGAVGAPKFEYTMGQGATWFHDPAGTVGLTYGLDPSGALTSVNLYEHEKANGLGPVFRTGHISNYSMQVTGGIPQVRYFASANLDDQQGIVAYNWLKGWSTRANLSVLPRSDLSISLNTSFIRSTTEKWQGAPDDVYRNLIWGGPARLNTNTRGFARIAPEAFANEKSITAGLNRVITSASAEHTPVSWLTQRVNLGIDVTNEDNSTIVSRSPLGALGPFSANSLGMRSDATTRYEVKSFDWAATANATVIGGVTSATSVGLQYFNRSAYNNQLSGTQFPAPGFETIGSMAVRTSSQSFIENATVGSFINQTFGWKERLFLTAAVRGDDNSSFGKEFEAAYYPKLSGTWVISDEPFWANLPKASWIDQVRLRAAWGAAGRQPDAFAASRLYGGTTGPGDQAGVTPVSFGNPQLKPERSEELEAGFDAGFLSDRIQLGYTFYTKNTTDAIVPAPVAPSTGIPGTQVLNVGALKNWGHEFSLGLQVLQRDRFRWGVNTRLALMRDRVDDLGGLTALPVGDSRAATFHRVGYPSQAIFAIRILSATLNPDGSTINEMCDGGTGRDGIQPGGALVPCASAPAIYWGRGGNPTWEGSVASNVEFGGIRFDAQADGRGGLLLDDDDIAVAATTFNNTSLSNLKTNVVYQAYRKLGRAPIGFTKGGFVRLRNVAATYTLPPTWGPRVGLGSRISATLSARNVALLWQEQKYVELPDGTIVPDPKVRDPERRLTTEVGTFQQAQIPPLRSVLMTIRMAY